MTKQGQGLTTVRKENGFLALFNRALGISKKRLDWPYWHIDLNAGCGFNEEVACDGSPLIFLRATERRVRPINAFFCDRNESSIASLRERLALRETPSHVTASCEACDNSDFLNRMIEVIGQSVSHPSLAIGTCLCDPNGYNDMPLTALIAFMNRFPRIDLVLNINFMFFRCVRGIRKSTPAHPNLTKSHVAHYQTSKRSLAEIIDAIPKKHWLIRNPKRPRERCGADFSILTGWNANIEPRRFQDFFPLTSPQGREILAKLGSIHTEQQFLPFMEE